MVNELSKVALASMEVKNIKLSCSLLFIMKECKTIEILVATEGISKTKITISSKIF